MVKDQASVRVSMEYKCLVTLPQRDHIWHKREKKTAIIDVKYFSLQNNRD